MESRLPDDRPQTSFLNSRSPRSFSIKPFVFPSSPPLLSPKNKQLRYLSNIESSDQPLSNLQVKASFQDLHLQNEANLHIFKSDLKLNREKAKPSNFSRNISFLFSHHKGHSLQIPQVQSSRLSLFVPPGKSLENTYLTKMNSVLRNEKTSSFSQESLSLEKSKLSSNLLLQNSTVLRSLEKMTFKQKAGKKELGAEKRLERHLRAAGVGKRGEVLELSSWTDSQISRIFEEGKSKASISGILAKSLRIYNASLEELIGQIEVENKSQAEFLGRVWNELQTLVEKALIFESEQQLSQEKRLLELMERIHKKYQERLARLSEENSDLISTLEKVNEKNRAMITDSRYLKKKEKKYAKDYKSMKTYITDLQNDNANLVKDNVRLAMHNQEIDAQAALELNQRYIDTLRSSLEAIVDQGKVGEHSKVKKLKEIIQEIDSKSWRENGKKTAVERETENKRLLNYLQDNMKVLSDFEEKHRNLVSLADAYELVLAEKATETDDLISTNSRSIQACADTAELSCECKLLPDPGIITSEISVQCNLNWMLRGRIKAAGIQVGSSFKDLSSQGIQTMAFEEKSPGLLLKGRRAALLVGEEEKENEGSFRVRRQGSRLVREGELETREKGSAKLKSSLREKEKARPENEDKAEASKKTEDSAQNGRKKPDLKSLKTSPLDEERNLQALNKKKSMVSPGLKPKLEVKLQRRRSSAKKTLKNPGFTEEKREILRVFLSKDQDGKRNEKDAGMNASFEVSTEKNIEDSTDFKIRAGPLASKQSNTAFIQKDDDLEEKRGGSKEGKGLIDGKSEKSVKDPGDLSDNTGENEESLDEEKPAEGPIVQNENEQSLKEKRDFMIEEHHSAIEEDKETTKEQEVDLILSFPENRSNSGESLEKNSQKIVNREKIGISSDDKAVLKEKQSVFSIESQPNNLIQNGTTLFSEKIEQTTRDRSEKLEHFPQNQSEIPNNFNESTQNIYQKQISNILNSKAKNLNEKSSKAVASSENLQSQPKKQENSPFLTEKPPGHSFLELEKPVSLNDHDQGKLIIPEKTFAKGGKKVSFLEKKLNFFSFYVFSRSLLIESAAREDPIEKQPDNYGLKGSSHEDIDPKELSIIEPPKLISRKSAYLTEDEDLRSETSMEKSAQMHLYENTKASGDQISTMTPRGQVNPQIRPSEASSFRKKSLKNMRTSLLNQRMSIAAAQIEAVCGPQKTQSDPISSEINGFASIESAIKDYNPQLKALQIFTDSELFVKLFGVLQENAGSVAGFYVKTILKQNFPPNVRESLFVPFKLLHKMLKKSLKVAASLITEYQQKGRKQFRLGTKTEIYRDEEPSFHRDLEAGYQTEQNHAVSNSHFSLDIEDFKFSEKEVTSPEREMYLGRAGLAIKAPKKVMGKARQITVKYGEMAENLLLRRLPELLKAKVRSTLSLGNIYKLISSIYQEALRLLKKKEDHFCDLPAFLCDFFIKKFGLKKVAENKILSFLQSLASGSFENNRRIRLFLRFLGLDENSQPFPREFEFFLGFLEKLADNIYISSVIFVNIERLSTSWPRLLAVCDEVFDETGRGRVMGFERELARKIGITQMDDVISGEEFDRVVDLAIEFFREINADLYKIVFNLFARREQRIIFDEMKVLLQNFTSKDSKEIEDLLRGDEKTWDFVCFKKVFLERGGVTEDCLMEFVNCEDEEEIENAFRTRRLELTEKMGNRIIYRKLVKIVEVCMKVGSRIAIRTMIIGYKILMNEFRQQVLSEWLIPDEYEWTSSLCKDLRF